MKKTKQPKSAFKGGSKARGLKKGFRYVKGGRVVRAKKRAR